MKYTYKFNTEEVEIEVDEKWGNIILELDRQEYNDNHRETRRHCSLDLYSREGCEIPSKSNVLLEILHAEDIDNPMDTATTSEGLSSVLLRAERTWPAVSVRSNITNFSGVRAHLDTDDFVTGPVSGAPDAFEAIGIESPGLSSAPAVAVELSSLVAESMSLVRKPSILPPRKPLKPFHDMDDEERAAAVRSDPLNGNIICRCEIVTEAEIREAIRRPVGARTVDGVKRRTRAGMGRCQGGFCSPRVASIISEETGLSLKEITKDGGESRLLADTVESFLKGGSDND